MSLFVKFIANVSICSGEKLKHVKSLKTDGQTWLYPRENVAVSGDNKLEIVLIASK